MQRNLIYKDFLLVRHYLIGFAVVVLGCYTFLAWGMDHLLEFHTYSTNARLAIVLSGCSYCAFLCSFFLFALIAGSTFAMERQDRSCEFMDALPPNRIQRCTSKAVIIAVPLLITVAVNTLVAFVANRIAFEAAITHRVIPMSVVMDIVFLLLGSIGIGWCISSLATTTGAPILLGLISPLLIMYTVFLVNYLLGHEAKEFEFLHQSGRAGLVTGILGFLIGSLWFIREGRA